MSVMPGPSALAATIGRATAGPGKTITRVAVDRGAAVGRALRWPGKRRVAWRGSGRLHLAVRGIGQPQGATLARAVETALSRHPAVRWAAVNAPLGVVIVACDEDPPPVAEFVAIIEQLELDHAALQARQSAMAATVDRV